MAWALPSPQAVAPAGAPSTGCSAELPALGRVQPFPGQEGADLARLRTVVGLVQDTQLGRELALGLGHHFRIRNVGWRVMKCRRVVSSAPYMLH
jgi:hypothetical protein